MNHKLFFLLTGLCLLLVSGCGYHNPYAAAAAKKQAPQTIHLAMWHNQTNELGLESLIHQALNDWLQQSKSFRLVGAEDGAEYQLSGRITNVDYPGASFSSFDQAKTLNAIVKVEYELKDKTGKKVLPLNIFAREHTYDVAPEAVRTQSNKKKALNAIADEIAETIYISIFHTFSQKSIEE
ncbi:MAG: PqiC family protein [Proteobacteria bacterium]|nr:PqiC family protein [Pseudomonadota bacterium]MBU1716275.1 PqiC family protein [Pseudomonadota bacterium]